MTFTSSKQRARKAWRIIVLGCITLALGCASAPLIDHSISSERWLAEGRIALKYPFCREFRACEARAVNATFAWQHLNDRDLLTLFDPSGQAQLHLDYQGERVKVRDAQQEQWLSKDELASRLGVALPLDDVAQWLRMPHENEQWQSAGWQVRTQDWRGSYYRRLTMTREDYRVRLLIDEIQSLP